MILGQYITTYQTYNRDMSTYGVEQSKDRVINTLFANQAAVSILLLDNLKTSLGLFGKPKD